MLRMGTVFYSDGSKMIGQILEGTDRPEEWMFVPNFDKTRTFFLFGRHGWRVEYDPEPLPTGKNAMIEVTEKERLPKTYVWDGSLWNPVLPSDRLYAPEFGWRLEELQKNGDISIRIIFKGEFVCACGEREDSAVHAVNHPANRGRTTHPFRGRGK